MKARFLVALAALTGLSACIEEATPTASSGSSLLDSLSGSPDVIHGTAAVGNTSYGTVAIPVERIVNLIATACYDDLMASPVTGAVCADVDLGLTPPNRPCFYHYCKQALSNCVGWRAMEAAENLGATEWSAHALSYKDAEDYDPQRPGWYAFAWNWNGANRSAVAARPVRDSDITTVRLPPLPPEERSYLYEVAVEYFKDAIVRTGQAARWEDPQSGKTCFDTYPSEVVAETGTTVRETFLATFAESVARLDEAAHRLSEQQVAVGSQVATQVTGEAKFSLGLRDLVEWNNPRINSRLSAATALLGRSTDGGADTDLGECPLRLVTEAEEIAAAMIRASRIGFWLAQYEDTDRLATDVVNAGRHDDHLPLVDAREARAMLALAGTSTRDLAHARDYLIQENKAFLRRPIHDPAGDFTHGADIVRRFFGVAEPPQQLPSPFLGGLLAGSQTISPSGGPTLVADPDYAGRSAMAAMVFAGDLTQELLNRAASGDLTLLGREGSLLANTRDGADAASGSRRLRAEFLEEAGLYELKATFFGKVPAAPVADGSDHRPAFVIAGDDPDPQFETTGLRCALYGNIEGVPCNRSSYDLAMTTSFVPADQTRPGWMSSTLTVEQLKPDTLVHAILEDPNGRRELVATLRVPPAPGTVGAKRAPGRQALVVATGGTFSARVARIAARQPGNCSEAETTCVDLPASFVPPLENELTEDSDPYENSWRHYLLAAEDAARVADDLGQQLVQYGLDADLRAEEAEYQIAGMCGDVGETTIVDVPADGSPPSGRDAIAECTGEGEEQLDFVSLGGALCLFTDKNGGLCQCAPETNLALCKSECPLPVTPAPPDLDGAAFCRNKFSADEADPDRFVFHYVHDVEPGDTADDRPDAALDIVTPIDEARPSETAADCEVLRRVRCQYETMAAMTSDDGATCTPEERERYAFTDAGGRPAVSPDAVAELVRQDWFNFGSAKDLGQLLRFEQSFLYHSTLFAGTKPLWTTQRIAAERCPWNRPYLYRWHDGLDGDDMEPPRIPCVTVGDPYGDSEKMINFLRRDLIWTQEAPTVPSGATGPYYAWTGENGPFLLAGNGFPPAYHRYLWGQRILRTLWALSYMTAGMPTIVQRYRHERGDFEWSSTVDQNDLPPWLGGLLINQVDEDVPCTLAPCYLFSLCDWNQPGFNDPESAVHNFCRFEGVRNCLGGWTTETPAGDCLWDSDAAHEAHNAWWLALARRAPEARRSSGFVETSYFEEGWEEDNRRAYLDARDVSVRARIPDAQLQQFERFLQNWWSTHARDVLLGTSGAIETYGHGQTAYWNDMLHGDHVNRVDDAFEYALLDAFTPSQTIAKVGPCSSAPNMDWFCVDRAFDLCQEDDESRATYEATCDWGHSIPQAVSMRITASDGFDALELLCHVATAGFTCGDLKADDLPKINDIQDLDRVAQFLTCQGNTLRERIGRLVLTDVPRSVFEAVANGPSPGDFGGAGGQRRALLADITVGLRDLREAADRVRNVLSMMATDVQTYKAQIEAKNYRDEIEQLQNWHEMTMTLLDVAMKACSLKGLLEDTVMLGMTSTVLAGMAAAAIGFAVEKDRLLSGAHAAEERQLTASLYGQMQLRASEMQTEFAAALRAYEAVRTNLAAYRDLQNQAKKWLSRLRLETSDEASRTANVNRTIRARFNTTRIRYDRALAAARKMAFIARRAIEFRLGVDMGRMHDDLTLVPAPSTWYRDVCTMTGIDYERISGGTLFGDTSADAGTADGGGAGDAGAEWTPDYAGSFIGDYVARLRNFVESYGIRFPFTDTSDLAVLSLRDDVYRTAQRCERDSYNLLLFADDVGGGIPPEEGSAGSHRGWRTGGCESIPGVLTTLDPYPAPPQIVAADALACVSRRPDDPASACFDGSTGIRGDCGGSWAIDDTGRLHQGSAGNGDLVFDACLAAETLVCHQEPCDPDDPSQWHPVFPDPPDPTAHCAGHYRGFYAQRVSGLDPGGTYLLSWYAAAANANPEDDVDYEVSVHDVVADGETLVVSPDPIAGARFIGPPPRDDSLSNAPLWKRFALVVRPAVGGTGEVEIRLHPSAEPTADFPSPARPGALYVRAVQLERTPFGGLTLLENPVGPEGAALSAAKARAFELVVNDRRLANAVCPDTDGASFRNRFARRCMCLGETESVCTPDSPRADTTRCFYEGLFTISLEDVESGQLIPSSSLARDNFNYRHEDLALNLVGTNVRACHEDSPDFCYSNGFVPFTVIHSGYVGVRNHDGDILMFDMPNGRIDHGKALAAEVVVTNPPTSGASALLAPFTRDELRGRPLDGGYVIRLWDVPELDWGRVEDVQLVLKYRYWTALGGRY